MKENRGKNGRAKSLAGEGGGWGQDDRHTQDKIERQSTFEIKYENDCMGI